MFSFSSCSSMHFIIRKDLQGFWSFQRGDDAKHWLGIKGFFTATCLSNLWWDATCRAGMYPMVIFESIEELDMTLGCLVCLVDMGTKKTHLTCNRSQSFWIFLLIYCDVHTVRLVGNVLEQKHPPLLRSINMSQLAHTSINFDCVYFNKFWSSEVNNQINF